MKGNIIENWIKKIIFIYILMIVSFSSIAQNYVQSPNLKPTINEALDTFGFTEEKIITDNDTIVYYLSKYKTKPNKLVLHIQGTDPFPVFFYQLKDNGETRLIRQFNEDYKSLDSNYAYAIVAKPGLAGIFDKDNFTIPKKYHELNYKEYRVNQIHFTIEDITQKHLKNPDKIIVYGHSEGAQIAAELAQINKHITNLGFWSGNVLNNFYEFTLFERIAALKEQQTDSTAHANIMKLLDWYKSIIKDPLSTEVDQWGYTNRRWSSYEEAPINNLLNVNIPIYSVFATEDESTPIETAYLLPVQFLQHRKNNLTFKVYMNYDHSYRENVDGKMVNHWGKVFKAFMEWTNKN